MKAKQIELVLLDWMCCEQCRSIGIDIERSRAAEIESEKQEQKNTTYYVPI